MDNQDPTASLSSAPPSPPPGMGPDDVLKAYEHEGQEGVRIAKEKASKEAEYARAEAAHMQGLQQKFEGQYQQAPEFKPTLQSKEQLVALFGMLGAMGALAGGKGYGNALIAMNGMTGMLNGYAQGRKDLFDQEKAKYDEGLKAVNAHNQQITEAFNRAVKMAPYNLSSAKSKLQQDLASLDAQMLQAQVDRQGIIKASEMWSQTQQRFEQSMLRQAQTLRALDQAASAKAAAEAKAGGGAGVGSAGTLSRLIDAPVGNIRPKEAETILQRLYTLNNTLQIVDEAKDPEIRFGEIGRAKTTFESALKRNVTDMEGKDVSPNEMASAIETAANKAGLDPNDKNVVFYKKALFSAMALEREARGGSILPQGMFNRLTPLFDPGKTTKDAFIGIMQDRAREVAQASGLTEQQLGSALGKLRSQKMPFDTSKSLTPFSGTSPSAPKAGKYKYNPETGEMEPQ